MIEVVETASPERGGANTLQTGGYTALAHLVFPRKITRQVITTIIKPPLLNTYSELGTGLSIFTLTDPHTRPRRSYLYCHCIGEDTEMLSDLLKDTELIERQKQGLSLGLPVVHIHTPPSVPGCLKTLPGQWCGLGMNEKL